MTQVTRRARCGSVAGGSIPPVGVAVVVLAVLTPLFVAFLRWFTTGKTANKQESEGKERRMSGIVDAITGIASSIGCNIVSAGVAVQT